MEIYQKILHLASPTICNTLFLELCLEYSSQAHTALEHIRQIHTDAAGNQIVSTVQAYFQQLMSAACPFSSQWWSFTVSVCQWFMDGLDPRLLTGFCHCFTDHSVVQALNGSHQHRTLQLMLKAAQQAEENFTSMQHALLAMPLVFLKLFRQLHMRPGPTRQWPCPARPRGHSVSTPHREDIRPSLQPAKRKDSKGRWPAMAVGGRIHGRNTNRALTSLFAPIKTIQASKRMQLELWNR
jgi:hypothetical protein